jgi:hypothetical protein
MILPILLEQLGSIGIAGIGGGRADQCCLQWNGMPEASGKQ